MIIVLELAYAFARLLILRHYKKIGLKIAAALSNKISLFSVDFTLSNSKCILWQIRIRMF